MIALVILWPTLLILALVLAWVAYRPAPAPLWEPAELCAIHGTPCPDQSGCLAVYQAECAAHGLPGLATGGEA